MTTPVAFLSTNIGAGASVPCPSFQPKSVPTLKYSTPRLRACNDSAVLPIC
jgi:hypothetical protein